MHVVTVDLGERARARYPNLPRILSTRVLIGELSEWCEQSCKKRPPGSHVLSYQDLGWDGIPMSKDGHGYRRKFGFYELSDATMFKLAWS